MTAFEWTGSLAALVVVTAPRERPGVQAQMSDLHLRRVWASCAFNNPQITSKG